jgi:hypothetical protein
LRREIVDQKIRLLHFFVMKRIIFNLILITLAVLPCVMLLSFSILGFLAYKSLQDPQNYARHNTAWTSVASRRIYRNVRNSWQVDKHCAVYDEKLLYVPSSGCNFDNIEFKTVLSFDQNGRISPGRGTLGDSSPIFVLGDSHAMGWGVNDDETFSHLLQAALRIPVYNLGVSSYGTVREIERALLHPEFKTARCVIVSYDRNDKRENITYLENGALPPPTKERFEYLQDRQTVDLSLTFVLAKTFEHLVDHPGDIFWFLKSGDQYSNIKKVKKDDKAQADIFIKVVKSYTQLRDKKLIVIGPEGFIAGLSDRDDLPDTIMPLLVRELDILGFYPIDGHENSIGHKHIARAIFNAFTMERGFREACDIYGDLPVRTLPPD